MASPPPDPPLAAPLVWKVENPPFGILTKVLYLAFGAVLLLSGWRTRQWFWMLVGAALLLGAARKRIVPTYREYALTPSAAFGPEPDEGVRVSAEWRYVVRVEYLPDRIRLHGATFIPLSLDLPPDPALRARIAAHVRDLLPPWMPR